MINFTAEMDSLTELRYKDLLKQLEPDFGPGMDLQTLLFLMGVDILGTGFKKFTKDQKTDLMHIAICTILEPYGYYKFVGNDKDNWPHFEFVKELPALSIKEQQLLMLEAVLEYFENQGISTKHVQLKN